MRRLQSGQIKMLGVPIDRSNHIRQIFDNFGFAREAVSAIEKSRPH